MEDFVYTILFCAWLGWIMPKYSKKWLQMPKKLKNHPTTLQFCQMINDNNNIIINILIFHIESLAPLFGPFLGRLRTCPNMVEKLQWWPLFFIEDFFCLPLVLSLGDETCPSMTKSILFGKAIGGFPTANAIFCEQSSWH